MDDWDEEQLKDVIDKKHGEKNKSLPPTSIVRFYTNLSELDNIVIVLLIAFVVYVIRMIIQAGSLVVLTCPKATQVIYMVY